MEKYYIKKVNINCITILVLLILIGVLFYKHFFMFLPQGPILWDEYLYKENAKLLINGKYFFSTHYPPLYSLIISIGLYFKNWYESIQIINEILSTLLIIPVWMISRMFVSRTLALLAVLLTILLPFQIIYPGFVMSENLFLFLFLFTIYFTLKGANTGIWKSALLGVFIGFCYLTRYMMLPAIPILILFWIIIPFFQAEKPLTILISKQLWINCIIMFTCFFLTMLPWIIFAIKSGFSLSNSLGLTVTLSNQFIEIADNSIVNKNTFNLVLMWISTNAAYIFLSTALYITLISLNLPIINNLRKKDNEHKLILLFLFLLLTLTCAYILISSQHSFRVKYNYPIPIRLMGRYLIHLTPLFIIAGIISLDRIIKYSTMLKKMNIIITISSMFVIITISWWILFKKGIWGISSELGTNILDAPDTLIFKINYNFPLLLVFIGITSTLLLTFSKINSKKSILITIIILLTSWQSMAYLNSTNRTKNNNRGIHARKIAEALKISAFKGYNKPIYYSIDDLWPFYWKYIPLFWDAPAYKYYSINDSIPVPDALLLTQDSLPEKPIISYKYLEGNCFLYKLNTLTINHLSPRCKE